MARYSERKQFRAVTIKVDNVSIEVSVPNDATVSEICRRASVIFDKQHGDWDSEEFLRELSNMIKAALTSDDKFKFKRGFTEGHYASYYKDEAYCPVGEFPNGTNSGRYASDRMTSYWFDAGWRIGWRCGNQKRKVAVERGERPEDDIGE